MFVNKKELVQDTFKAQTSTEAVSDLTQEEYLKILHVNEIDSTEDKAYADEFVEKVKQLDGGAIDTLIAAFKNGPLSDGDVPSKVGRDLLVDLGFMAKVVVEGEDGYNAVTYEGRSAFDLINVSLNK